MILLLNQHERHREETACYKVWKIKKFRAMILFQAK